MSDKELLKEAIKIIQRIAMISDAKNRSNSSAEQHLDTVNCIANDFIKKIEG